MSIDLSQINYPVRANLKMEIQIPASHFLVLLSENIPWREFADLAIADLYRDRKRSGRKLNLRLHLGAFILQSLLGWKDRELQENLNFYAPARAFCGLITGKSYDHSAYVKFRNRITVETASKLSGEIIRAAAARGFTGPQELDLDSTVQEANIEYPSDIRLMQKLAIKGKKVLDELIKNGSRKAQQIKELINFGRVAKECRGYFFAKKSEAGMEQKKKIFSWMEKKVSAMVKLLQSLSPQVKSLSLKWNIQRDFNQLSDLAPVLLKQIRFFIKHGQVSEGKILSLHAKEVKCISKGKAGRPYEFGRKYFVGRLAGNYALGFTANEFALEDAHSMDLALKEFEEVFGAAPSSVTGDQAFWSRPNLKACNDRQIQEVGITPRGHKNWKVAPDRIEQMKNRRAGVEPIIGHLKRRGMGKSRMKTDGGTKLSGQRAVLSLNLARLAKDLALEELKMSG